MGWYAEERQQAIAELAREHGRVAVADLARAFEVTSETIRRDLDSLATRGLLSRVHGGAVPAERVRLVESAVHSRETVLAAEKQRIAEAALAFLPEGDDVTVLLDAGTTVGRLATLLPAGRIQTVVTNCMPTATVLGARGGLDLLVLGGRLRGITQATVGSVTVDALRRLHVDVAFLGANGVTERGCSTPDPAEGEVKRAMVAAARTVVVLADSSKIGSDYLVNFAPLADVRALITDTGMPEPAPHWVRESGIEAVCA